MRVAINGCGIAGTTLAWWLRHYGHDPVLFERASGFRDGGYIVDFWGSGFKVAERMGLIPELRQRGYVMEKLESRTLGGLRTASLKVGAIVEIAGGDYFSIARSALARAIFEACDGIETRFGTEVTSFENAGEQVSTCIDDGSSEQFDLLIGADGLHSHTRALLFGEQAQFERSLGLHVAAYTIDGYHSRDELTYVQYTMPRHQISRVSLRDDKTLALFVFNDNMLPHEPIDEVSAKAALRAIFAGSGWECDAILARLDEAQDFYFDRVAQIDMPAWSKGRVGLIGDAAACASLLAGEGCGLAMTEAYVLAGELHRSNGDVAAAFAAYEAQMKNYVRRKQQAARRFKGFFSPSSWLGLGLRELATNLAAVPFLAKPILGAGIADQMPLPEYAN